MCREAALAAIEEGGNDTMVVAHRHFTTAIALVPAQVNDTMRAFYESFEQGQRKT